MHKNSRDAISLPVVLSVLIMYTSGCFCNHLSVFDFNCFYASPPLLKGIVCEMRQHGRRDAQAQGDRRAERTGAKGRLPAAVVDMSCMC